MLRIPRLAAELAQDHLGADGARQPQNAKTQILRLRSGRQGWCTQSFLIKRSKLAPATRG